MMQERGGGGDVYVGRESRGSRADTDMKKRCFSSPTVNPRTSRDIGVIVAFFSRIAPRRASSTPPADGQASPIDSNLEKLFDPACCLPLQPPLPHVGRDSYETSYRSVPESLCFPTDRDLL